MNDLRFHLLKPVPGMFVAQTAALNKRLGAAQGIFLKESNCTRKYNRPHDCHMNILTILIQFLSIITCQQFYLTELFIHGLFSKNESYKNML